MSEQQSSKPRVNILAVDDTPDNLRLLSSILADHEYDVRTASNGKFALQSAQTAPPDLILLDIKMPGMDGYEVCQQLKADERTRDIPVIFISALNEIADKLNGFALGGVDYITKPFQSDEVLARVNTHLTLRRVQQELERELGRRRQAEEALREANASKDKFFSIIAHDLRSPFTGLIGITGLLVENLEIFPQEKLAKIVSRLHASVETTYALLTNLLAWSRLQRGLMDCVPDRLSLTYIAEKNTCLFTATAEQKQITLKNLVPQGTMAYADPTMVDAVIRNLLSNAVKFTPAGGTIEVSAHAVEDRIELAVADSGIGMRPEALEKLFRIDVKSSHRGTDGEEGTGLGLILCKEFVEKNGGTIRVTSEVGKGTTFVFTLPTSSPPRSTNLSDRHESGFVHHTS